MPRTLSPSEVEDFRDRLCETATRLFAEQGAEAVTLRQLAVELGVSPMTPYRYFKDKEDILAAVRARAFDQFSEDLEEAYGAYASPIERSSAVGAAYIRFGQTHPEAYKLMFDVFQPHEENYPDLVRATTRARATMTQHVRGLIDAGIFEGDAEKIGTVLWSGLHGALVLHMAGKLPPDVELRQVCDELFRLGALGYGKVRQDGSRE